MEKQINNADIFEVMERWAPINLAYEWDNVGLQIGSYTKSIKKVMITLDVLESVVDEAIEKEVDLIIAHHPLLFKSLKQIDINTPKGRVIHKLIQHDISVYASHTNLDIANGGVNDILCDLLNVDARKNLIDTQTEKLFKLAIYVPQTHVTDVRNAISLVGAGHIGSYSHCTFQTGGKGTFKPLEGTNPFIGTKNELTFVDEIKIETIVKETDLSTVVSALLEAHPYEEAAYDVFPMKNEGQKYGIGRIGDLNPAMSLEELIHKVKAAFEMTHVRVTGDLTKHVKKVAILGGSGEKFITQAKQQGADVYITGDMTFHVAQDAQEKGLAVIDAGHYIEHVMKKTTYQFLASQFDRKEIEFIVSETNTDPFQTL